MAKSNSLSLKPDAKTKLALGHVGTFAGGTVAGFFLRGRYAAPLGFLGAVGGLLTNKPYVTAASLGMVFSAGVDVVTTGGAHMRSAGTDQPFSFKTELDNGVARTKMFFSAMARGFWLDKIFGKKAGKQAGEMVDQSGDAGEGGDLGFLGSPAAATLDRIEQNIIASAMQFDAERGSSMVPANLDEGDMMLAVSPEGNIVQDIDLMAI